MALFATAGGVAQLEYCCEYFAGGVSLIAGFLALRGAVKRSLPTVLTGLAFASVTQVLAVLCVLDFKPSDDPDETHMEGLVWRVLMWSSASMFAPAGALVWVLVKRRQPPPPPPPNPFEGPTR